MRQRTIIINQPPGKLSRSFQNPFLHANLLHSLLPIFSQLNRNLGPIPFVNKP